MKLFATWRTSADVARDAKLVDDPTAPMPERLVAAGRTSPAELDAHASAVVLLGRARLSRRGPLTVAAELKTITALAAPLAVVLAAIGEAGGVITEREVLQRFALGPRDVGWIVEATLVDACITELVRRRLVERVVGGVRASQHVRRAA